MLSEKVKELEEKVERLEAELQRANFELGLTKEKVREYKHCCEMVIPNHVYTHKKRRNTTVKFLDGESITVTRKEGEKDCIETAIAYCIMKRLIEPKSLKKLIEEREEH